MKINVQKVVTAPVTEEIELSEEVLHAIAQIGNYVSMRSQVDPTGKAFTEFSERLRKLGYGNGIKFTLGSHSFHLLEE